jgi:PAS domain S-box-containing protein
MLTYICDFNHFRWLRILDSLHLNLYFVEMGETDTILFDTTADFKTLFESVHGLYLVLLPDLTIVAASDAYLSATLTKRENIVGNYLSDIFPDDSTVCKTDSCNSITASIAKVIKNKKIHGMSIQRHDIKQNDGTLLQKYWSQINKPVLNSNNEVIYIIHRVEDVTEYVLLQNALKTSDNFVHELKSKLFEMESELFSHSMEMQKTNEDLEQKIVERNLQMQSITRNILEYKAALDESSIVAITDQKGIIRHVNHNFCKISKYTKEELIGQDHRIVNSGYHSKEFMSNLWKTISSGAIWRGEIKNKAKDGCYYWVDTTIVPFFDKKRKPIKYLAIRSDITARKQTFEYLNESRESYLSMFENSLVAMYTVNFNSSKIIEVNSVALKLFGYSTHAEMSKNCDPLNHYVNLGDREIILQSLKIYGEAKITAVKLKKQDGTIFWGNFYGRLNSTNNTVQCVLVDVSELKFNEEKYRNLFENGLVPIFIIDPKALKIISVNEIGVKFFGYQSSEDFSTNYNPLNHFVNLADLEKIRKEANETGSANLDNVRMKKLDGSYFSAKIVSKMSADKRFVQTAVLDITSQIDFQHELEEKVKERTLELTKSLEREKELNEVKTRFVSYASHELRTPLSCILSSVSLIEMYKETEQQESRIKHTQRIAASVNDLKNMLDEFLAMAQLEKTELNNSVTSFNLPTFFRVIIEEMHGITNKKDQKIEFVHDGTETIISSDKILKNIILNLLSNASKYSPASTSIHVHSALANKHATISIKDHGIGIPEADQKKLFIEFFRAGNVNGIQGTGLGLNIVKKYVELLSGNISFVSKVGEGTTFTIEFPCTVIPEANKELT